MVTIENGEIKYKEFLENDSYKVLTIDDLKHRFNEFDIDVILFGRKTRLLYSDREVIVETTDYEHPIVLFHEEHFNNNYLYIDEDWFLNNKDLSNELIRYICRNFNKSNLEIKPNVFINDEVIEILCGNEFLRIVNLGNGMDDKYSLTKEHYLKFKNSHITRVDTGLVDEELKENFDELIGFNMERKLISSYNYMNLQEKEYLILSDKLNEEEILNLKYLSNDIVLEVEEEAVESLSNIVNELNKLGKNNKIKLRIEEEDKESFNKYLLKNDIDYSNLFIVLGLDEYSFKDYLRFEKMLYDMVEDAKDLSPFEKYIFVYNVVKKFKKYKENDEDRMSARKLYNILDNDYMVCVGFSNMFGDLLNKLGIKNSNLSVSVDISYDDSKNEQVDFEEVKEVEYDGHARRRVHIVDEKYGINGFYVADPTWDNDLEKDYYNYLAMTDNEVLDSRRYFMFNMYGTSEIFNVNSLEEYIQKINFILSRKGNEKEINYIMKYLITDIEKLDSEYIKDLKQKYAFIDNYEWPLEIDDLVFDLGNYLLSKVNKEISGEVIMEAVSNVYRYAYGYSEEELGSKMEEIVTQNKEKQNKAFPSRYNVKEDGSREVYIDVLNKFDIQLNGKER